MHCLYRALGRQRLRSIWWLSDLDLSGYVCIRDFLCFGVQKLDLIILFRGFLHFTLLHMHGLPVYFSQVIQMLENFIAFVIGGRNGHIVCLQGLSVDFGLCVLASLLFDKVRELVCFQSLLITELNRHWLNICCQSDVVCHIAN